MRVFSLKCREVIEFLDRYVAGELPAGQTREFEWHLRLCRSCRAYLRTYRDTLRLETGALARLEKEDPSELPEELVAAILAAREA
ncbi:MAG: anti-sigma factor family protein [Thermoanaerobaculia bacterium]